MKCGICIANQVIVFIVLLPIVKRRQLQEVQCRYLWYHCFLDGGG